MGMKGLMCEILADKQKELIESLESQLRTKNEIIINETKRANEMFRLSYNRKLQIKEQQAEMNRLRTALENLIEAFLILKRFYPTTTLFADEHIKNINKALNGESEGKC